MTDPTAIPTAVPTTAKRTATHDRTCESFPLERHELEVHVFQPHKQRGGHNPGLLELGHEVQQMDTGEDLGQGRKTVLVVCRFL